MLSLVRLIPWLKKTLPERHQRGGFHESLATFQNTQWTLLPQPSVAWHVFADHNLGDGHADCAVARDVGQVKEIVPPVPQFEKLIV
jgi:hypothetical protein